MATATGKGADASDNNQQAVLAFQLRRYGRFVLQKELIKHFSKYECVCSHTFAKEMGREVDVCSGNSTSCYNSCVRSLVQDYLTGEELEDVAVSRNEFNFCGYVLCKLGICTVLQCDKSDIDYCSQECYAEYENLKKNLSNSKFYHRKGLEQLSFLLSNKFMQNGDNDKNHTEKITVNATTLKNSAANNCFLKELKVQDGHLISKDATPFLENFFLRQRQSTGPTQKEHFDANTSAMHINEAPKRPKLINGTEFQIQEDYISDSSTDEENMQREADIEEDIFHAD